MTITNVNGTSDTACKCGSWLNHWKKFSGRTPPEYCPVVKCLGKDLVGAHVQKADSIDRNWYIAPLCSKCNAQSGGRLEVADWVTLVSANKSDTCAK